MNFEGWSNPMFIFQFGVSCVMGFILMYAILVCTQKNSALTTTVVGCMKNLFVTYAGMMFGGDYIFSMVNFVGINVSVVGSLIYSYCVFIRQKPAVTNNDNLPK
jgi:solute carrier family 35 protein